MRIVIQCLSRITVHAVKASFVLPIVATNLIIKSGTNGIVDNTRDVAFEITIIVQLVEIKISIRTVVFAFHIIGGNKGRHNGVDTFVSIIVPRTIAVICCKLWQFIFVGVQQRNGCVGNYLLGIA